MREIWPMTSRNLNVVVCWRRGCKSVTSAESLHVLSHITSANPRQIKQSSVNSIGVRHL